MLTKIADLILEVGVHNPVSKTEVMASFKTKAPRVITVCLDMIEGVCKFWLNDLRQVTKTLQLLPVGGPWIPCVKLGQEGNCVSLNPFAREPSSFYE